MDAAVLLSWSCLRVCVCVCKCVSGCVWYFWYFCYDNHNINNNLFITLMKNCNIERTDNPSDLSILQASASAGLAGPGQVTRIQLAPSACYLYTVFPWRAFVFFSSYWASNALKEAGCPVLLKTMTEVSGDKWPQPRMSCQTFLSACWDHRASPEVATVAVHLQ